MTKSKQLNAGIFISIIILIIMIYDLIQKESKILQILNLKEYQDFNWKKCPNLFLVENKDGYFEFCKNS